MYPSFFKCLLVVIILLAQVGQGFTYASMSCDMSNDSGHSAMSMDHGDMSHTSMQQMMSHISTPLADCCEVECDCPVNACSNFSIAFTDYSLSRVELKNMLVPLVDFTIDGIYPSSLYRPPILT